jgi:hypothetical protein
MVTLAAVLAARVGQALGRYAGGLGTSDGIEARTYAKTSLCNIAQSWTQDKLNRLRVGMGTPPSSAPKADCLILRCCPTRRLVVGVSFARRLKGSVQPHVETGD